MHILTAKEYNREIDSLKWTAISFAKEHGISVEDVTGHPEFQPHIDKIVEKYFPNDARKQESEAMRIGNNLERELKNWR